MKTQLNYNGKMLNYDIYDNGVIINRETGKEIPQYDHPSGYISVSIYDPDKKKSFIALLHRLMLMSFSFIDDFSCKEVNHLDGNKHNNSLQNLEWCTKSENAHHAYKNGLNPRAKTVYQYGSDGFLVGSYYSVSEASRQTGIREPLISGQINGEYKSAGGYRWSYILIDSLEKAKIKRYKRTVVQKNKESLEIIAEYDSAMEASRITNIQQSDITRVCQGKRKTAGGFCWSYKE